MKNIIILGDIHGNFHILKKEIERLQLNNTYLIQVGDFGIGFNKLEHDIKALNELNVFLKEKDIEMLAIRGNHDDPKFFNGDYLLSNLKLLEDYTVLDLNGENFLFVGGAISIDRVPRLAEMKKKYSKPSWWFDEIFKLDITKIENLRNISNIVTHTSPDWCHPENTNGFGYLVNQFASYDMTLLESLKQERNDMSELFNTIKLNNNIKCHYYGHFHDSKMIEYQGTKHYLLGINEFKQH